ncbi:MULTISPECIES: alpha/beta fold hydrolase [unclassified Sphingobacterium]|uniref:alpha/beta fold hydrolase n=1 Tax=unclassified Sphingobacterium TaxID=2609468 RepID=UPI0025FC407D|nr:MULTISPECIES: alpha/beta hydrolase [unclassified Sphingobacterium]
MKLLKFSGLFFKWALVVVLILIVVGILFEQYSRWRLEKDIRTGRTFEQINGHDIHYVKMGKGNYTVVFESGLASDHFNWRDVQQKLAEDSVVTLAYDRSGFFLSEAGDTAKTNTSISDELYQLLEKTHCPKPYIVVGHSMGAIYLRSFIDQHRKDIAGIVFVEGAHPLQMKKSSPEVLKAFSQPPHWAVTAGVETGIFRLIFSKAQVSPEIPMDHPFQTQFKNYFYKSYDAVFKEAKNDVLNFEMAEHSGKFGNIPLTVIMGNPKIWSGAIENEKARQDFETLVSELHHDMLSWSADSHLVIAQNSGHIVQVNDADLIIQEIRSLLSKISTW